MPLLACIESLEMTCPLQQQYRAFLETSNRSQIELCLVCFSATLHLNSYSTVSYSTMYFCMPDMICVTPWPKAMISCAFEMFAQLVIEVCGTNSVPIANGTYQ